MIVVIGEILIDLISTNKIDSLCQLDLLKLHNGGSAANFAKQCHKLGAAVRFVGAVGADGLGKKLLHELNELGIDTNQVNIAANKVTSIIIVSKSDATPEFMAYRQADAEILPQNLNQFSSANLFHTTAFALSKNPAQQNILNLFRAAHTQGKQVSIDWNYTPKIWGLQNNAQEIFEEIMSYQPLLKISMDDAHRSWDNSWTAEQVMQKLNEYNAQAICLTCGGNGVYYKQNKDSWQHKPALPIDKVNNTTGAGDAFWSGFVTHFMNSNNIHQAVDNALLTAKQKLLEN
jgi:sugar/nucleoside kinase (ribokinase family)